MGQTSTKYQSSITHKVSSKTIIYESTIYTSSIKLFAIQIQKMSQLNPKPHYKQAKKNVDE